MTPSKHTPGEWRVVDLKRRKAIAVVGPDNDGVSSSSDRICAISYRKNGEALANAHVISASGDLLDAAKIARRHLRSCLEVFGVAPSTRDALAVLDAAIAKATGEEA